MNVKQLIEKLSKFSPDAEVSGWCEGAPRVPTDEVWMDENGQVLLGDKTDREEQVRYARYRCNPPPKNWGIRVDPNCFRFSK